MKIDFSHPRFGSLLGSVGFDGRMCLWKESNDSSYECVYEYKDEEKVSSMNYITFSKNDPELVFATGGVDGNIIIHQYKNDKFISDKIFAHDYGVNAINFNQNISNEFVSCGNDCVIKIWELNKETSQWENTSSIEFPESIFTDVAFKNGSNEHCFACGNDEGATYLIWKEGEKWNKKEIATFDNSVSQLSWNENGTILVATLSDGELHQIEQENLILEENEEN